MEWAIGLAGLIIVNILTWTFLFGRRGGRVNNKIKNIEDRLDNPQILPQCTEIFTEIKEKLSNLGGKLEILLGIAKENQKNNEKKREINRRKSK